MAKEYDQKIYRTTDLYLAAFLKAKNWFVRLERDGSRCTFTFIDDKDLKKDIESFFNDGEVGANSYKNAIQDLKTMMYNT